MATAMIATGRWGCVGRARQPSIATRSAVGTRRPRPEAIAEGEAHATRRARSPSLTDRRSAPALRRRSSRVKFTTVDTSTSICGPGGQTVRAEVVSSLTVVHSTHAHPRHACDRWGATATIRPHRPRPSASSPLESSRRGHSGAAHVGGSASSGPNRRRAAGNQTWHHPCEPTPVRISSLSRVQVSLLKFPHHLAYCVDNDCNVIECDPGSCDSMH